jgi:hypothetical protein
MKRFSESRMREIRTSGSMRGKRIALFGSSAFLLYRRLIIGHLPVVTQPCEIVLSPNGKTEVYYCAARRIAGLRFSIFKIRADAELT